VPVADFAPLKRRRARLRPTPVFVWRRRRVAARPAAFLDPLRIRFRRRLPSGGERGRLSARAPPSVRAGNFVALDQVTLVCYPGGGRRAAVCGFRGRRWTGGS